MNTSKEGQTGYLVYLHFLWYCPARLLSERKEMIGLLKLSLSKKYCGRCGDLYYAYACPACKPPESEYVARLGHDFLHDELGKMYRFYRYLILPDTLIFLCSFVGAIGLIAGLVLGEELPLDLIGFQMKLFTGSIEFLHIGLSAFALALIMLFVRRFRKFQYDDPAHVARLAVFTVLACFVASLVNIVFLALCGFYIKKYVDAVKSAKELLNREKAYVLPQVAPADKVHRIQNGSNLLWRTATSPLFKKFLDETCRKYRIPEDRQPALRDAIECVMLGMVHKDDFIHTLQRAGGITLMGAATLADEICHQFLIHFEEEFEATYKPLI